MKRIGTAFLLILIAAAVFAIETGDTLAVSVREGELRTSAGFLSAITARIQYGSSVRVLGVQGDWVRVHVEESGDEGWMHNTAVMPPGEMNLTGATDSDTGTTSREIALAGRGFNEQVEEEYQEQNELDFGPVDDMETLVLPPEELVDFLTAVDAGILEGAE